MSRIGRGGAIVKVVAYIWIIASMIGLSIMSGCDARDEQSLDTQMPNISPEPVLQTPQTMISIWNMTTSQSGGDLIVEVVYTQQGPGTSLLPPKTRRINLGSGMSVAGFYDVGVVNLRAAVSPEETFHLDNVKLMEGSNVKLTITDNGFEFR